MFSSKFEPLIAKYPSEADALLHVAEYFAQLESKGKRSSALRLTPERLQNIAQVNNKARLAHLIFVLLSEHIFRRYVVINSPSGGGIAEFNSIDEVPEVIHDPFRDIEMQVTTGDLRTLYRVHEAQ